MIKRTIYQMVAARSGTRYTKMNKRIAIRSACSCSKLSWPDYMSPTASNVAVVAASRNTPNHSGAFRLYSVQPSAGGSETDVKASTNVAANSPNRIEGQPVYQ